MLNKQQLVTHVMQCDNTIFLIFLGFCLTWPICQKLHHISETFQETLTDGCSKTLEPTAFQLAWSKHWTI